MLGDYVAQMLPELRAQAESMMTDTVTITRPGPATTNPDTSREETPMTTVYTGRAALGWADSVTTPEVAGGTTTVQQQIIKLPIGSYTPQTGDRAEFTSPGLAGVVVRMTADAPTRSNAVQWKIPVDRLS